MSAIPSTPNLTVGTSWLNFRNLGADPSGVAAADAVLSAALATLAGGSGGGLYVPSGIFLLSNQVTIPDSGAGQYPHVPIVIRGDVNHESGSARDVNGGSQLDLRVGFIRSYTDGVTTNASTTHTSATANFTSADVGRFLAGAGITLGSQIVSVTNATTVVMSYPATASASGVTVSINIPKIWLRGDGKVTIRDLSLVDNSAGGAVNSAPFLLVSRSALTISDVTFQGNPSKSGTACDQDCIILGANSITFDGTMNSAFAGYCFRAQNLVGHHIRRLGVMQGLANHCIWDSCQVTIQSGAPVGVGILESIGFDSTANTNKGHTITKCLFEMGNSGVVNYSRAVRFVKTIMSDVVFNKFYDSAPGTTEAVWLDADSARNMVIGPAPTNGVLLTDLSNTAFKYDNLNSLLSIGGFIRSTRFQPIDGSGNISGAFINYDSATGIGVNGGYTFFNNPGGVALYAAGEARFRGNVLNDSGAALTIVGGTSGNVHFSGTGTATVDSALAVGTTGTPLKKTFSVTANLDFPSIAATGGTQDLTVTVTGAAVGDSVFLGPPSAPNAGIVFNAFVSSANTVTVRATNATAGAIDPASATFRVTVLSF